MLKTVFRGNASSVSARGTTIEPCRLLKKFVQQGRDSLSLAFKGGLDWSQTARIE
jgi:hypothetical protein